MLSTVEEEKDEIMTLLQLTHPEFTKIDIMIRIFPIIQHVLELPWYIDVKKDEFVAVPVVTDDHRRSIASMYEHATKSTTLIRKEKVF